MQENVYTGYSALALTLGFQVFSSTLATTTSRLVGPTYQLLCEKLPKIYVLSADRIFTTFCAPFSYRIFRSVDKGVRGVILVPGTDI